MRSLLFVTMILCAVSAEAKPHHRPSSLMPTGRGAMADGQYFPPVGKGVINPRTGAYMMPMGRHGYYDTRAGRYIPSTKWRERDE